MAGLFLGSGLAGVSSAPQASYGSNEGLQSVTSAAFGPGVTVQAPSPSSYLDPSKPVGLSIWVGSAAVLALVLIRRSLPN